MKYTEEFRPEPTVITVEIYESETAATPIEVTEFIYPNYTAEYIPVKFEGGTYINDIMRVKVRYQISETLLSIDQPWFEMRLDARTVGTREKIQQKPFVTYAKQANDVYDKSISPKSISIPGKGVIINEDGEWVGSTTGLQGPQGEQGPPGPAALITEYWTSAITSAGIANACSYSCGQSSIPSASAANSDGDLCRGQDGALAKYVIFRNNRWECGTHVLGQCRCITY